MVALDLDGTLLEPSGLISQTTLNQLKRINDLDIKIVIATGRPYARTLDPLRGNSLYPGNPYPHLLICEERDIYGLINGVYVPWERNKGVLEEERSHLSLARRILAELEQEAPHLEYAINNNYSQKQRGFLETYFVYPHEADEAFAILTRQTENTPLKVTRNRRNVCLRSRNVGKGITVRSIANHYGCNLNHVLAVGDSHNDLEMLSSGVQAATTQNADHAIKDIVQKKRGLISSLEFSRGVGDIIERMVV